MKHQSAKYFGRGQIAKWITQVPNKHQLLHIKRETRSARSREGNFIVIEMSGLVLEVLMSL